MKFNDQFQDVSTIPELVGGFKMFLYSFYQFLFFVKLGMIKVLTTLIFLLA